MKPQTPKRKERNTNSIVRSVSCTSGKYSPVQVVKTTRVGSVFPIGCPEPQVVPFVE
jgi:hypothetical protein